MSQEQFFSSMQGYAMSAGAVLGIPYQVILAQWGHESAYGTSDLAKRALNFGGIKYTDNADFKSGSYAGYKSIPRFVQDYIRVMQLPYYAPVRQAGGIRESIEAFGQTPYAEDKSYAGKLLSIVKLHDTSSGVAGNSVSTLGNVVNVVTSPLFLLGVAIYYIFKK